MLEHCNPTVPGTVRIMVFIYRDKDAVLLMLLSLHASPSAAQAPEDKANHTNKKGAKLPF